MVTGSNIFRVMDWQEETRHELDENRKLTQAQVIQDYQGFIAGRGECVYLITYTGEGSAQFVGAEYFKGSIGGKRMEVVFQHHGEFANGTLSGAFAEVDRADRSVTGELVTVSYGAPLGQEVIYQLDDH